jgi:acetyltransferase-like isoleucine patch superfamily enzyme
LYKEFEQADLFRKIIIGNNVYIGINVTILSGTKVGDNVIIGAGSLVRGELKSNSVYAGVPVKYICSIDEFKEKNSHLFINTLSTEQVKKEKIIREMFSL